MSDEGSRASVRMANISFRPRNPTYCRPFSKHPVPPDQTRHKRVQTPLHPLPCRLHTRSCRASICSPSTSPDASPQSPLQDQQQLVHRDELGQVLGMRQSGRIDRSKFLWPGTVGEEEGHHQRMRESYMEKGDSMSARAGLSWRRLRRTRY